jgi:hypothetical protein
VQSVEQGFFPCKDLREFVRIRFCTLLPSDGCLVGIVQGTDFVDNQLIFCFPWSQGALHKDNLPALMLF